MDRIFPEGYHENLVICVPGKGAKKPFSALMTDITPDLNLNEAGTRCFPMRFADREAKTTLIINEHVRLSGIPEEAHRYVVNGRTPLEWFIDRYKITQDRASSIINDPNGWFENPRDLITAIERIVYVNVKSTKIIEGLPVKLMNNL